jgi:hypothetical protein
VSRLAAAVADAEARTAKHRATGESLYRQRSELEERLAAARMGESTADAEVRECSTRTKSCLRAR